MNETKRKVILIGSALAAQLMYKVLQQDPSIEVTAFAVNEEFLDKLEIEGIKVYSIESLPKYFSPDDYVCINGVGYSNVNQNRESTFNQLKSLGYEFLTYIHPSATILTEEIGEGTFIMPGAVIEPFAEVGCNTVVWSNAVVAHHVIIGDNCWIASGVVIAGESEIKKNVFLGVNATITNKITVGEFNIVGAGALITKDTESEHVFLARSGEKHRFDSKNYAKFFGL